MLKGRIMKQTLGGIVLGLFLVLVTYVGVEILEKSQQYHYNDGHFVKTTEVDQQFS